MSAPRPLPTDRNTTARIVRTLVATALVLTSSAAFAAAPAARNAPRNLRRALAAALLSGTLGLGGCGSAKRAGVEIYSVGVPALLDAVADTTRDPFLREGLRAAATALPEVSDPASAPVAAGPGYETAVKLVERHGLVSLSARGVHITVSEAEARRGVTLTLDPVPTDK